MKWSSLRLNMLPITAVEVEYAIEQLSTLHQKVIKRKIHDDMPRSQFGHKPLFVEFSKELPDQHPQQYASFEELLQKKQTVEKEITVQIEALNKFYKKHSFDESAPLFHMLGLKLQRALFDCRVMPKQLSIVPESHFGPSKKMANNLNETSKMDIFKPESFQSFQSRISVNSNHQSSMKSDEKKITTKSTKSKTPIKKPPQKATEKLNQKKVFTRKEVKKEESEDKKSKQPETEELKFTIRMSRQEYAELLKEKSKFSKTRPS